MAMDKLRELDQIAYIRFASVYQSFEDIEQLQREVNTLLAEREQIEQEATRGLPRRQRRRQALPQALTLAPSRIIGLMAVLSDRDIRAAMQAGRVRIDPYDASCLQPSSVDLHLDADFRVFRNNRYPYIDVRAAAARSDRAGLDRRATSRSSCIPTSSCWARRSSGSSCRTTSSRGSKGEARLGRLGLLIHSTAGYVDPGWKGNLTLELSNVANLPIALYRGMKIGQISFFKMTSPVERPYGSRELGSQVPGPVDADRVAVLQGLRRRRRERHQGRPSDRA